MRIVVAMVVGLMGTALAQAGEYAPQPIQPTAAAAKQKAKPKPKAPQAQPAAHPTKPAHAAAKSTDAPGTTGSAAAAALPADPKVRESYSAIPFGERISIQSDLVWTGDYNGLINGEYSDRLVVAVKAFQKRNKGKLTGVLNPQERQALAAAARPHQHEVGWRLLQDPVTGARVGLPGKLATKTEPGQTGTRWASAQGQLQIETFRIDTGATLEAVFEQQKKEPARRRVTYNALRPDFFVVSGTQGLKKFYVRASAQDGEVRGITILYDQAMEGTMDPVVVAMSSAFVPFASGPGAADGLRRKVEYGTGIIVSASGHIVTANHAVEDCRVIAIPGFGNAERVAEDKGGTLALLRIFGAHKLSPIGLIGAGTPSGTLMLIGVADPQSQAGGGAVSAVPAQVAAGTNALDPVPALGFSGAAALDSQGRFAGVAVLKPSVVAGSATEPKAIVMSRSHIANFLEANYVAPASGQPGVENAKASVVRTICVRK
jgi:peptidoglycan hydrolase-like protein with peptidoglycan-binding domain